MRVRFFLDEETGLPHIHNHGVNEEEVEDVLTNSGEDRPGREGSRVAIGQTFAGRYLRVIYVRDPEPNSLFVITCYELSGQALLALSPKTEEETQMKQSKYPSGWNEAKVRRVLRHYESQTENEAIGEDEAAFELKDQTVMVVPRKLVPEITKLIAKRRPGSSRTKRPVRPSKRISA